MCPLTSIDQMGRRIELKHPPQRIISLVPSQTELLFYLGLDETIVGITKFCIHPPQQFRRKTRIGGTKQLKLDKIRALQPDLIIANKEENDQAQITELAAEFPVWISDVLNLDDALDMMQKIGQLVDRPKEANDLIQEISFSFAQLPVVSQPPSVAYFIWRKPWMVAGNDTFIHSMLDYAGFFNYFGHLNRYPEVDLALLENPPPDFIFLSSEPYPFREKHLQAFEQICPASKVVFVDGELFSWYGSRLLHSAAYFRNLRAK